MASGPSLNTEDVDYCRGRARAVVVNTSYRMAPWADALYACDPAWWEVTEPQFTGLKFTQAPVAPGVVADTKRAKAQELAARFGCRVVLGDHQPGLSLKPDLIHFGGNSGYQALNLAVHLGAARVVLLGYDMGPGPGGRLHWFGDHPAGLNQPAGFAAWVRNFETTVPDLKRAGVSVVNCSRVSALTCFPRGDLRHAL